MNGGSCSGDVCKFMHDASVSHVSGAIAYGIRLHFGSMENNAIGLSFGGGRCPDSIKDGSICVITSNPDCKVVRVERSLKLERMSTNYHDYPTGIQFSCPRGTTKTVGPLRLGSGRCYDFDGGELVDTYCQPGQLVIEIPK